jgi:aspartyl-tRNA(Asn)/glutamyl-tRNA(Gln) amidotransferase subunit A
MTRTAEDAAILLQTMAGFDEKDSTSVDKPVPDYLGGINQRLDGLTIGLPKEFFGEGLDPGIAAIIEVAVDEYRRLGATVKEVSMPNLKYAIPAYYIIAPAEASSNLARYDGVRYGVRVDNGGTLDEMYCATRAQGFGAEVQRRILIGTYVLSAGYYDAYYLRAQKVRALIARDFAEAFQKVDAILTPTAPSDAFKLGEKQDDPITMYLNDVFTVPASLAGVPAMSVPAGLSAQGLPLGLQVIGRMFDEETVLKVGAVLEGKI